MYRSSSTTRVSEEFFFNSSPSIKSSISSTGSEELPTFNPQSHIAKKERNRLRSAENAIHLIPLVLVLSAIVLWVFSSPDSTLL
ncbi:putative 50S ribosomal protein L19, chloroplastic-like [Capsicum annuum]|nr:putative 50S ribosomal protein L19, chloroplastic-like [Capsicum annuum]